MTENTSAMHLDHDLGFLRPMTEVDLELVLAWRNHPSIRAHMYAQHEITKDEHRAWWTRVASSPTAAFFIYERLGVPLGYVSFSEIESKNATATWGFYTAPDAPRGTGTLMSFAAMDLSFGALGIRKLSAQVLGRNAASQRLHEKFGFVREGRLRDHVLVNGQLVDVHCFALFADIWVTLRSGKLRLITERLLK